jgi:hypothetical protein
MLFVYDPVSAEKPNPWMTMADLPAYVPQPNWHKVESFEPDTPYLARLVEATGLNARLPQGIWRKLRYRHAPVTLYEIPA